MSAKIGNTLLELEEKRPHPSGVNMKVLMKVLTAPMASV